MLLIKVFCSFFILPLVLVVAAPATDLDLTDLNLVPWYLRLRYYGVGTRIVGGQTASRFSFPYQAALFIDHSTICGGSLISSEYVMTAAHCTYGSSSIFIVLGAHNFTDSEDTRVFRSAASVHDHPGFCKEKFVNDISIIKLSYPVTLNIAIQPVNLAPRNAGSYSGQSAVAAGWGKTSDNSSYMTVLHYVRLTVMNNGNCSKIYNIIQDSHVCSSGFNGSAVFGACSGDSGGALVSCGVQIGIISLGLDLCAAGFPTVYTRVSSYRNWIAEITGI